MSDILKPENGLNSSVDVQNQPKVLREIKMLRIITVDDIRTLMRKVTLKSFILRLIDRLEKDFLRWNEFEKTPRLASHYPHGIIELMPISDKDYYAYKYVNGHPANPLENKQTVVAIGTLADVNSGYPVLISEMTILTALRTAATSALAAKYLANKNIQTFGIIGTGAQSEFQVLAHHFALGVNKIYYYDLDLQAMQKFALNLKPFNLELIPCANAEEVVRQSQIVTTATAKKARVEVVVAKWVQSGAHINGIGGDCPDKTELDAELVKQSKIVVEYLPQTELEGEVQYFGRQQVHAELWELIAGEKKGRETEEEITLFDSVGFALEDYSVLRLVYALAEEFHVGHMLDLVPSVRDPKDLFSLLNYK